MSGSFIHYQPNLALVTLCCDISRFPQSIDFTSPARFHSYTLHAMEVIQQPVLHVEARVKNTGDGMIVRTDLVRSYASELVGV